MKTYLYMLGIIMTLSMVPIGGCFHEVDMGFPKKVEISAAGGTETFYGEPAFVTYVDRGRGTSDSETVPTIVLNRNDSLGIYVAKYDWLTVACEDNVGKLTLTADANTSGKQREISIEMTCCYNKSHIKVIQKGVK